MHSQDHMKRFSSKTVNDHGTRARIFYCYPYILLSLIYFHTTYSDRTKFVIRFRNKNPILVPQTQKIVLRMYIN